MTRHPLKNLSAPAAALIWLLALASPAPADTLTALDPVHYQAHDILTSTSFGSYDVAGQKLAAWTGTLKVFDLAHGTSVDLGAPSGYSGYNSFTTLDPSGSAAWVGFTVIGNVDDRIYRVDLGTGTWVEEARLPGNYDLAFSGTNVFVSGLNSTNWMDSNKIWLLDTTGGNIHREIADVGGVSAGLDFDAAGNLYYGTTNPLADESLIRYSAAQIAAAATGSPLSRAAADVLSTLPTDPGSYPHGVAISDVAVDDAENVLFNFNQVDPPPSGDYASDLSYVALWDGTAGSGQNYSLLAQGSILGGQWLTGLAAVGDVTQGGRFYQGDYYAYQGLAEVTSLAGPADNGLPEPSTLVLAALGAVLLLARRRSWRVR